ncbi:ABC transporter permease subunit [bacterium]|nr:ABC transporter permease subunit [bacterium]
MRRNAGFSTARVAAVFFKELVQMRRDRLTFAIMIGMPVMQLILFGYAINTDPRHLPTIIERREDGPITRSLIAGLEASSYFDFVGAVDSAEAADAALKSGEASFVITIPEGFEERLVRSERPQLLISADASDPVSAAGPVGALSEIAARALRPHFEGALAPLAARPPPFEVIVHRLYNPTGKTAFNIVPGLLGVILTMTMVMITSIALTRETERGTMETLLSTPLQPIEIMIGKTTPYVLVGVFQTTLVLAAAALLFGIPFRGSLIAFVTGTTVFIAANLMLGYLISTIVRTQMQAMQMTFFVFLPSLLLSGFMFPFAAMPSWAQTIGDMLPLTHFLRIVRAVILKGANLAEIGEDLMMLLVILGVFTTAALLRFRRTID